MPSETLSVRLDPETRRILAEAAPSHDVAGASALAREILERWAAHQRSASTRETIRRAARYVQDHPEGWDDDPGSFFGGRK
ncbi:MAG: hypothetical protein WB609_12375 [Candidatus Cybelea sp.]